MKKYKILKSTLEILFLTSLFLLFLIFLGTNTFLSPLENFILLSVVPILILVFVPFKGLAGRLWFAMQSIVILLFGYVALDLLGYFL